VVNQSGAYAGVANSSVDNATGNITLGSRFISSLNGAASAPPGAFTGTWFTGGTATTTKPQVVIEPDGTTSTAWSTSGTGLGVNAASGFAGRLLDLQVNGTSRVIADGDGRLLLGTSTARFVGGTQNKVQIEGIDAATSAMSLVRNSNDGSASSLRFAKSNGTTIGSNTAVTNNTQVGACAFYGNDGSSFIHAANIDCAVDGTPGTNDMPGRLVFSTTADGASSPTERLRITNAGVLQVADAGNITVGTTTGTKIGTATTQKLGFYNATPVVQPTAVADITTVATAGTLPTADGSVTVADADAPTNAELLEYCVELEAKLEAALAHLRTLGLIAT
jgi:hypothetical protein